MLLIRIFLCLYALSQLSRLAAQHLPFPTAAIDTGGADGRR